MGYFHTAAEMLQLIRFAKTPDCLPLELREYIFRIEPRLTTPLNEFDSELESAIREGRPYRLALPLGEIDCLVMEVSSLSVNCHSESRCVLHTNPNIGRNVSYAEIYPAGYYAKFEPQMPVSRNETSLDSLASQLRSIRAELPHVEIIVLGHLRSQNYPNAGRDRIHELLVEACSLSGCIYFDTAPFLDEYGYAVVGGVSDTHHLSHEGEYAIGQALQDVIQSMHR